MLLYAIVCYCKTFRLNFSKLNPIQTIVNLIILLVITLIRLSSMATLPTSWFFQSVIVSMKMRNACSMHLRNHPNFLLHRSLIGYKTIFYFFFIQPMYFFQHYKINTLFKWSISFRKPRFRRLFLFAIWSIFKLSLSNICFLVWKIVDIK